MAQIGHRTEENLLSGIMKELETLLSQCEHKDKEIAHYKEYAELLQKELK